MPALAMLWLVYLSLLPRRADVLKFPVGHFAAGNGLHRHLHGAIRHALAISCRSAPAAAGAVARVVAIVPADARVGCRQAHLEQRPAWAERYAGRQHVGIADRTRLSLLDTAAADLDQLVRGEAARLVSEAVGGVRVCCRARAAVVHFRPAPVAVRGVRRDHPADDPHRRHGQLQLLQFADDRPGDHAAGRFDLAAIMAVPRYEQGIAGSCSARSAMANVSCSCRLPRTPCSWAHFR